MGEIRVKRVEPGVRRRERLKETVGALNGVEFLGTVTGRALCFQQH